MIAIAREKIASAEGNVPEFRVGGVTREAYSKDGINTVLAFNLLHLVRDFEASLAVIHDLLPEDGLFISKTPALAGKWYYRPMVWAMQRLRRAPYVNFLSVERIDAAVAAAGFRIVETGLYPPSTPSRFIVARKV